MFNLLIEYKPDLKVVGNIGIGVKDKDKVQAEMGWLLSNQYRGKGIATEAAKAVISFGFEVMGLHRVYAQTNWLNEKSWRLMERLGMRREAHFIQSYRIRGKWEDGYIYAVLADEWRGINASR